MCPSFHKKAEIRRIMFIVGIGMSALAIELVAAPALQCCVASRSAWECIRGGVTQGGFPCDATCTGGGSNGPVCTVSITGSCRDCHPNDWDKIHFASVSKEGTNIRRTVCSDGTSFTEYMHAPCGWRGGGRIIHFW